MLERETGGPESDGRDEDFACIAYLENGICTVGGHAASIFDLPIPFQLLIMHYGCPTSYEESTQGGFLQALHFLVATGFGYLHISVLDGGLAIYGSRGVFSWKSKRHSNNKYSPSYPFPNFQTPSLSPIPIPTHIIHQLYHHLNQRLLRTLNLTLSERRTP
jgi:hypothetical protein